jgi:hypothetical protein
VRKRALLMAVVMALTILASTRVASAQQLMVVNIPFDFAVGNKTLPAGEYSVKDSPALNTLLLLDREDPAQGAFLPTLSVDAREIQSESKLVFNRYGNRYFLSQVWSAGRSGGRQLSMSDREKEMAQVAKLETQGQVTLVASLPRTNP